MECVKNWVNRLYWVVSTFKSVLKWLHNILICSQFSTLEWCKFFNLNIFVYIWSVRHIWNKKQLDGWQWKRVYRIKFALHFSSYDFITHFHPQPFICYCLERIIHVSTRFYQIIFTLWIISNLIAKLSWSKKLNLFVALIEWSFQLIWFRM